MNTPPKGTPANSDSNSGYGQKLAALFCTGKTLPKKEYEDGIKKIFKRVDIVKKEDIPKKPLPKKAYNAVVNCLRACGKLEEQKTDINVITA